MKGMWGIYLHSFFMFLEKDLELLLLEKLQQISCVFLLHYKKLKQTKVDFLLHQENVQQTSGVCLLHLTKLQRI